MTGQRAAVPIGVASPCWILKLADSTHRCETSIIAQFDTSVLCTAKSSILSQLAFGVLDTSSSHHRFSFVVLPAARFLLLFSKVIPEPTLLPIDRVALWSFKNLYTPTLEYFRFSLEHLLDRGRPVAFGIQIQDSLPLVS